MTPYKPWDVILVPFPFTDCSLNKRRPAIVVSCDMYNDSGNLVIGFLTSNLHGASRLGDYNLAAYQHAGLPLPTRFRAEFATISGKLAVKRLGSLMAVDQAAISESIRTVLALV